MHLVATVPPRVDKFPPPAENAAAGGKNAKFPPPRDFLPKIGDFSPKIAKMPPISRFLDSWGIWAKMPPMKLDQKGH